MNYENAVPKPLKFLISDGKMIDDAGNVIAESDTLKDLYTKWNPEVKKYLLSDGSVVDENNNLIVKNDYYKKIYDQATLKVAKYLHSDGTVDENPGGGGGGTAYAWQVVDSRYPEQTDYSYLSANVSPADKDEALTTKSIFGDLYAGNVNIDNLIHIYTRTSDTEFAITVTVGGTTITKTFTRNSTKDFTLWQLSE